MTAGPFREVDFDLLADYVGGALDGTPDEARVARLVHEDPAWTQAYDVLAPAVELVHDDLVGWGGAALPMPTDVTDRLTMVLAEAERSTAHRPAGGTTHTTTRADRPSPVPTQPAGGTVRPPVTAPSGRARRRRWSRLAGPVVVATAVLGLAGLGLSQLLGSEMADQVTGSARDDSAEQAPRPQMAGEPRAVLDQAAGEPLASGIDYTPQLLKSSPLLESSPSSAVKSVPDRSPGLVPDADPTGGRIRTPASLARLTGPDALSTCLNEIAGEHRGSVTVTIVDYASFGGLPALVVRFTDGSGERWAWVAGPECGVPGSGADTRFRVRVG